MSECRWPNKQKHASRAAALHARTSLLKARPTSPDVLPYPCGDHYHLGHSQKSLTNRIRKALGIRTKR